jgi:hypothetical protein
MAKRSVNLSEAVARVAAAGNGTAQRSSKMLKRAARKTEGKIKYVLFALAVKTAKAAIAKHDKSRSQMQWTIGEMAYRLGPEHGDNVIERFAHAIGLSYHTVKDYRQTYRRRLQAQS